MKYSLFLFSIVFCWGFIYAEKELTPSYQIDSTVFRSGLKEGEAMFYFSFKDIQNENGLGSRKNVKRSIQYGFNGISKTAVLGSKNEFEVSLVPGSYSFQFYYSDEYYEISTEPIIIKSRNKTFVSCYLKQAKYAPVQCEKPVIYLYPETPNVVEVKVAQKGSLLFTYPSYNNGWIVQANPSGELSINEKKYNYLFWESALSPEKIPFDKHAGFIVDGENVVSFLEEKLTAFGLNSKEKADFITYWGPQLMKSSRNFVHFVFNEQCNDFAELMISPKPDQLHRIYIVFTSNFDEETLIYQEQKIPRMQRNGFTVVEWGGSNLSNVNYKPTDLN